MCLKSAMVGRISHLVLKFVIVCRIVKKALHLSVYVVQVSKDTNPSTKVALYTPEMIISASLYIKLLNKNVLQA